MTNTWGISGPTFLLGYAVLAALVAVIAFRLRGSALAERPSEPSLNENDPTLLAYLSGGPARALQTAVVRLRLSGRIEPTIEPGRWVLTTTSAPTHEAGPFEDAVLGAMAAGEPYDRLPDHPAVATQLRALHDTAERTGALLPEMVRRRARAGVWPMVAILALGVVRLIAGAANHKPVGWLLLILAVVAGGTVRLLVVRRQHPRLAASLTRLRDRHAVSGRPDLTGPALASTAALTVALAGWVGIESWGLFTDIEHERLAAAGTIAAFSAADTPWVWTGTDSSGSSGSGADGSSGGDGGSSGGDGGGGGCGGGGCGG
ncbi:MAG: TIGR04222 domain-containing membrane protein [Kineosporiaceae bacterium]|nr:TIGR04222 domain-containing membrane protein [Kineosporiaceae bacterium]